MPVDDSSPRTARPALCALDIETETRFGGGLDPTDSAVVAVALAFDDAPPLVFDDPDESVLLRAVDAALRERTGLLLTWNGAGFDLPFVAARAEALGIELGLRTSRDGSLPVKYASSPGLGGPVRASWWGCAHVDVAHLYREMTLSHHIPWSLKPVARFFGYEPVEVDRTLIHELSASELEAYVVSDAVVTLALGARLPVDDLLDAVLPVG